MTRVKNPEGDYYYFFVNKPRGLNKGCWLFNVTFHDHDEILKTYIQTNTDYHIIIFY